MNLVIIEGVGKVKKISEILGNKYKVFATCGHITQLNENINYGYGFEFNGPNAFEPKFQTLGVGTKESKDSVIKVLKELASKADKIYLATDPDREGEAIAYHIYNQISNFKNKISRITFNAINESEIMRALNNQRDIDMNLVHAQFCRQVYDRYLGYKLSNFVKKIFKTNNSTAGRVQSATLLLIANRECEIKNYTPKFWWTIEPTIKLSQELSIKVKLVKNDKLENPRFETKEEAYNFYKSLNELFYFQDIYLNEEKNKKPEKPLTTSEVLTIASKKFKWSAKKTTQILQKLYESGLVTYPRTDSIRMHPEFCQEGYKYVIKNYGEENADNSFWFNDMKQKEGVQDSHECIRVIDLSVNTDELMKIKMNDTKNNNDFWKLYNVIYKRTLQVFFKPAIYSQTTLIFENKGYHFEYSFKSLTFAGFLKYISEVDEEETEENNDYIDTNILYKLLGGKYYATVVQTIFEHRDSCPKRYSVGELIKKLEQLGIGRPSTFASMAEINLERENAFLLDDKINITSKGDKLNQLIQEVISQLISLEFTANFEKELDAIADGKQNWLSVVKKYVVFYDQEIQKNNIADLQVKYNVAPPVTVISKCLKCDGNIILKTSKNGKQYHICENKKWDANNNSWSGCESDIVWLDDLAKQQALAQLPKCKICDGRVMTKTTANGKKYKCCSNRKYDTATGTTSGCVYFEWVNDKK